jgi:hypothetical protein
MARFSVSEIHHTVRTVKIFGADRDPRLFGGSSLTTAILRTVLAVDSSDVCDREVVASSSVFPDWNADGPLLVEHPDSVDQLHHHTLHSK